MEIYPLALTQVDWSTFVSTVQDVLGVSPTRGLDSINVDMKDPSAYLRALNMENDPKRIDDPSFRHYQLTFIAILDEESLLLLTSTDLTITAKKGRRDFVVIVSATVDVWVQTVLYALHPDRQYELRAMLCMVMAHLKRVGFTYLFSNYEERQLADGTFVLRKS